MKTIGIAFAVLFASAVRAEEPRKPTPAEWALLGAAEGLIVVDMLQTLDLKRHPGAYEVNPLLGSHPSDARVIVTGVAAGTATAALWYALPSRIRWIVPLFVGIGEGFVIASNAQAGMTIRF